MRAKRIFLAIEISEEAREICALHVERLRTRFPDVRVGWERPEKMHVTLKFLGNTSDEVLARLKTRSNEVAREQSTFSTALAWPGVFPNRSQPRILWVGLEDAERRLERIHKSIDKVCGELGYKPDTKRFTPHITIGRVREPRTASALALAHLETDIQPVQFNVPKVVIYESRLQSTGSVYEPVASLPLGC
jgi:2'-5' RNA ligase